MSGNQIPDQRKSYRCPVQDDQRVAELIVGSRRVPLQIFNESSGGFGAIALCDPQLKAGDLVEFSNDVGRYRVRVAFIGAQEDEQLGTYHRLGLERLAELDSTPRGARSSRRWRLPGASLVTAAAIATAVALVTGLGTWFVVKKHDNPVARWIGLGDRPAAANRPAASRSAAGNGPLSVVGRQLNLSAEQQSQWQSFATDTARMMQDVDDNWRKDSPQQRAIKRAMLIEATKREIARLLTEEQRNRWEIDGP